MLDRPTPLSRRHLLVGTLGGLVVVSSGCDAVDRVLGDEDQPNGSTSSASTAAADDADSALVDDVASTVAAAGALAAATGRTFPALRRDARRLSRLHDAHARELGWSGTPEEPVVAGDRTAARRRLVRAEAALQDTLVAAAQDAESGALAQVLASMAAAVAQQRAVLA